MPINLKNKGKHKSGGKLSFDVPLELLRDEERQVSGFRLDAYTGAVVERWWGRLAIAVNGIQSSQRMPIFRDHDHTKIVGYSTSSSNADGLFRVEGVFCDATEQATEVRNLAVEGFPWQASIGVQGLDILELQQGQTTQVNGQTVSAGIDLNETSGVRIADGDIITWQEDAKADRLPRFNFGIFGCWLADDDNVLSYVAEDDFGPELLAEQKRAGAANAAQAQMKMN